MAEGVFGGEVTHVLGGGVEGSPRAVCRMAAPSHLLPNHLCSCHRSGTQAS